MRTSAIEVAALLKQIYVQKWKVCKKKNLSLVWVVDGKIRPARSQSGITRQASSSQTVILGTDFSIYRLPLTLMIDPYNISNIGMLSNWSLFFSYKYINIIWFCSNWLAMSNSCYNPFIYGLLNVSIYRSYRILTVFVPARPPWVTPATILSSVDY